MLLSPTSKSYDEVRQLIKTFSVKEKIELSKELERETFAERFRSLLSELKTDAISDEEILAEVEAVRSKRYAGK